MGQVFRFLPRTLVDLTKALHSLLTELAETCKSTVKNTLANTMEELRRWNEIATERYMMIKSDIL